MLALLAPVNYAANLSSITIKGYTMKKETRETIELLVDKANRLKSINFTEHVKASGLGFTITNSSTDELIIDFGLPDNDKFDGFLLTFRFFYSEGESISFSRIRRFLNDSELSDEWRSGVSKARDTYFNFLNGYSQYTVKLFEGQPTRRQMLDIFINGQAAHADPEKAKILRTWASDDIRANLLVQEISGMFIQILGLIKYIGELSEKELQRKQT
jgi:hypothetical protein